MKILILVALFLVPSLAFAQTLDVYDRTPSGDPIEEGTVNFAWEISGGTTGSVSVSVDYDPEDNIVSECITSSPTNNNVDILLTPGTVIDVDVISWVNSNCTNNNPVMSSGDAFEVSEIVIPPVVASTTLAETSEVINNGILLMFLSMFFMVWFFRGKVVN